MPVSLIKTETPAPYEITPATRPKCVDDALAWLESQLKQPGAALTSVDACKEYLVLKLAGRPAEVFACLFLDNQHRVIAFEELFQGTIDSASVYPREVLRRVIHHNAAAAIFTHNHPSGIATPSQADKDITAKLVSGLKLFDVRVLDHVIVAGVGTYSFTENGLL